jgi:2-amino-4-hydroxy-6-hydroxymethyldihydropteridine diphosphokinase
MTRAFIGIGSNIDPATNVRAALHALAGESCLVGISTIYLTEALGDAVQPPYYNGVAEIATEVPPREMKFGVLRGIEQCLGRQRSADKFAPRTMDLDLIVYGDLVLHEDGFDIPDPDILKRPFLAIPLCELAPDLVLAGYGQRISEIAAALSYGEMKPLEDYTQRLRDELIRR